MKKRAPETEQRNFYDGSAALLFTLRKYPALCHEFHAVYRVNFGPKIWEAGRL